MSNEAMKRDAVGAWLLHHDQKLSNSKTTEFENIETAGRATRILSAISREQEWEVGTERLNELARSNGIRRHEVPGLLKTLAEQGLVDVSESGVSVLGVTQAKLLEHAAEIFDAQKPHSFEYAAIDLAERASKAPIRRSDYEEEVGDQYKLSSREVSDFFDLAEGVGFVDYESDGVQRLYFNGTLFRRGSAEKALAILDGLNEGERERLQDAENLLETHGCVPVEIMIKTLGEQMWSRLQQIGFFEASTLTNERGQTVFVMKPSSLVKYVPSGLADMLDDAKALASSLTYGIIKSHYARGQIRDPSALVGALINRGYVEGPVAAITNDYKALEKKGVVQVTPSARGHKLTLLKEEVGLMARDLILKGDASQIAAQVVIGNAGSNFHGPEENRTFARKQSIPETKTSVSRTLNLLRKTAR